MNVKEDIIALLPVRNGEAHLQGYFDCVRPFVSSVLTLDDGSTDRTRECLESEPLVLQILANPRRDTYIGWDDSANRQRLLDASSACSAKWLLFLDVDERIPQDDFRDLCTFLRDGAIRLAAYGFTVHRMIDDSEHFDKGGLWVYRLFGARSGYQMPSRRLHFDPVPVQIPSERWFNTTIRIMHLSGLTESLRRARYEKYREVDPHLNFQSSYENLLDPPRDVKPWMARSLGQVVVNADQHRYESLRDKEPKP